LVFDSQALKRHDQQAGKGTLPRQQSIKETQQIIEDIMAASEMRKTEATSDIQHHLECCKNGANRYSIIVDIYKELIGGAERDQSRTVAASADAVFVLSASDEWFDISSDNQQDKMLPAWKQ